MSTGKINLHNIMQSFWYIFSLLFQELIDHLTMKNDDVGQVTNILSNHMNTTSIDINSVSPIEKFGVTNRNDFKERDIFLCNLQSLAPLCPVPDGIFPNQIYAVFSKERKWCRAQVAHALGICQVSSYWKLTIALLKFLSYMYYIIYSLLLYYSTF